MMPNMLGALVFVTISNMHFDNIAVAYITVHTKTVILWARYVYLLTFWVRMETRAISPTVDISTKINKEYKNSLKDMNNAKINNVSRMRTEKAKFFIFLASCCSLSSLIRVYEQVYPSLFGVFSIIFRFLVSQLSYYFERTYLYQLIKKISKPLIIIYFIFHFYLKMRLRCVEQYGPNMPTRYLPKQQDRNQNPNLYSIMSNNTSRLKYIDKQVAYTATNTQLSSPSQDGSRISWQRPSVLFRSTSKGNNRLRDHQIGQYQRLNSSTDNIPSSNKDTIININSKSNMNPVYTQLPEARMSSFSFNIRDNINNNIYSSTNSYPLAPMSFGAGQDLSIPTANQLMAQLQSRSQELQIKNQQLYQKNKQILILQQQYRQKQEEIRDIQSLTCSVNNSSRELGTYPTLLQQTDRMRKQLVMKNQELDRIRKTKDKQIQQLYELKYIIQNYQKRISSLQQKLNESYDRIYAMNGSLTKLAECQQQNIILRQRIRKQQQKNRKINEQNRKLTNMVEFQEGISEQSIRSSSQNSLYYPFDKYHQNTMSMQKQELEKDLAFHKSKNEKNIKIKQLQQRERKLIEKQKYIEARLKQEQRRKQLQVERQKQQQFQRQINQKKLQNIQRKQKSSHLYQQNEILQRQRKIQLELLQYKLKIIQKQNQQLQTQQKYLQNRVDSKQRFETQYPSSYNKNIENRSQNVQVKPQIYMLDQVERNPYSYGPNQPPNKQTFPCQGHHKYSMMNSNQYFNENRQTSWQIINFQDKSVIDRLNQFQQLHEKIRAFRRQNYSEMGSANIGSSNAGVYNKGF